MVDTNVLLVAEELHSDVSEACVLACQLHLADFMRTRRLALDDGFRILTEYGHKLSANVRQPGMGRTFYKWALQNWRNPNQCSTVALTPLTPDPDCTDFAEFPDHPGLADFDHSDRKFVAVSAAHPTPHPPIAQAADSKWIGWAPALREVGVEVDFLCKDELTDTWRRKMGE